MGVITDRQVRNLRNWLKAGKSLKAAAMKANMDEKTARKYHTAAKLPSELEVWPRTWRTREDPFAAVWDEVRELVEASPGLQAKTLFAWLQGKYPGGSRTGSCGRFSVGSVNGGRRPGRPRRCSSPRCIIRVAWGRPTSRTWGAWV